MTCVLRTAAGDRLRALPRFPAGFYDFFHDAFPLRNTALPPSRISIVPSLDASNRPRWPRGQPAGAGRYALFTRLDVPPGSVVRRFGCSVSTPRGLLAVFPRPAALRPREPSHVRRNVPRGERAAGPPHPQGMRCPPPRARQTGASALPHYGRGRLGDSHGEEDLAAAQAFIVMYLATGSESREPALQRSDRPAGIGVYSPMNRRERTVGGSHQPESRYGNVLESARRGPFSRSNRIGFARRRSVIAYRFGTTTIHPRSGRRRPAPSTLPPAAHGRSSEDREDRRPS